MFDRTPKIVGSRGVTPTFRKNYLCTRLTLPIQNRVPNLKSLAQVVLGDIDAAMVDMTLNDL